MNLGGIIMDKALEEERIIASISDEEIKNLAFLKIQKSNENGDLLRAYASAVVEYKVQREKSKQNLEHYFENVNVEQYINEPKLSSKGIF